MSKTMTLESWLADVIRAAKEEGVVQGCEDEAEAGARAAVASLTPGDRLALIDELARGLPGANYHSLSVSVATPADLAALGFPVQRKLAELASGLKINHRSEAGRASFYCYVPATAEDLAEMLRAAPAQAAA